MAEIEYPKNLNVNGIMSFPLYTVENINQLQEWRSRKGIPKPRFDDRISLTLLLTQAQHDRVKNYLLETYLPFAATLQAQTDKKKGIDPKLIAKLVKLVEAEDWSEKNLPIRDLNERDVENIEKNEYGDIVSKMKISGPPEQKPIGLKALFREDDLPETEPLEVVPLSSVTHLMHEQTDHTALWWGAGWPFRVNVRFNAFEAQGYGVSAYTNMAYLQAHRELRQFGGAQDADVLADGDDWE